MDNKRRFSRVTAIFDVSLTRDDGIFLAGTLRDIAVQGAFIICEPAMELGTPVEVTILLHGGIDDIPVKARATVVRREEGGLGVHFTEVDIESVEHLRNIITFNAREPDIVWEEMQGGHLLRDA
ncbi:MAG: PilZ domain-containing protein [Candidatus Hydrogenedentes bacterium]|nr:PilZ domain-containing protein [Candidatus Hydrogenedentota bacterium]